MLVEPSPETRVPVPLKAEVPIIRELQDCSMRIRLEVQSKRDIEPACPKVESPDVCSALFVAKQRVQHVVEIQIEVVVLKRPSLSALAPHVVQNRIKAVTAHKPALKIEARDGRILCREFLQQFETDRLTARRASVLVGVELRHDLFSEPQVLTHECAEP